MLIGVIACATVSKMVERMEQVQHAVDGFECRLDYLDSLSAIDQLREATRKPLILTPRNLESTNRKACMAFLDQIALCKPDFIDIEHVVDLSVIESFHRRYPQIGIIRSYHDYNATPKELIALADSLSHPALTHIKMATFAKSALDSIRMLVCVKSKGVIGHCMGEFGRFSRVLGPVFNSPMTYVAVDECVAPGMLSLHEMNTIYRVRHCSAKTAVYALVGDPVSQSMGHHFHNKRFKQRGIDAVYVKIRLVAKELKVFFEHIDMLGIRGLSVTMPLKEAVVSYLDQNVCECIGAINTVKVIDGRLYGYNTDGLGACDVLGNITGRRVAIVGVGGAGRAIAYEAIKQGASVTLINRDVGKAATLAKSFNCDYASLSEISAIGQFDLVIDTLPVARDLSPLVNNRESIKVVDYSRDPSGFGEAMFASQARMQQTIWSQIDNNASL